MIDVHVLTLPNERQDWLDQCLTSLQGHPIQLHVIEGVQGHIGQGRIKGYSQGTSPYVASVDSDDRVLPGAFDACLQCLESNSELAAAWTAEHLLWNDELIEVPPHLYYMHHIVVFRRAWLNQVLDQYQDHPYHGDVKIRQALQVIGGIYQFTKTVGYLWRMNSNSAWRVGSTPVTRKPRWRIGHAN